ncbi:carbohydrate ABC transporter permease [Streptomyces sp. DT224]|uniref:carbohydrate ABC transporter permease n=1 Tax=Streptomyces sp. DT224 TaxID=3393426 RepID=UPI003CE87F0C
MSRTTVNTLLVLTTVYTFFPLVWMVLAAISSADGVLRGDVFSLGGFDLHHNLSSLWHTDTSGADTRLTHGPGAGIYGRWYLNSILYAGVGALGSAVVSVAAGYAFDKYHFRGKEHLFGLVLVGVLVPGTATVIPLYLLAAKAGVVNTVWAVLIPSLVNPFGVYLARIFSAGYIPDEVVEAARMDGAGEVRLFRSIGFPMIRSGFTTIFLFQFSAIWNSFFLAMVMLTDDKLFPVSLGLFFWNNYVVQTPALLPVVLMGSLLAILPMLIVFVSLQRFWRSGLTAGSVK